MPALPDCAFCPYRDEPEPCVNLTNNDRAGCRTVRVSALGKAAPGVNPIGVALGVAAVATQAPSDHAPEQPAPVAQTQPPPRRSCCGGGKQGPLTVRRWPPPGRG